MKNYLSFGGGVNSVALHLLLLDQGTDFESVFAHHGTDWPETYDYLAGFQWWLKANGHRPITILFPSGKFRSVIDKCEAYRMVPTMRQRWCTVEYKIKIIEKHVKAPCFQLLGIDAGEAHRAKIGVNNGIENRWPLIEHDIDRDGCKEIIKQHGLPVPVRSGCYICPMQRKSQWKELRQKHPCLFARAVALEQSNMEYSIEKGKKPFTLSSSKKTLPVIVNENQKVLFEEMEYPPCHCGS